ncbi:MAG: ChaN family lipoprotein [Psychromonas sp.]
MLLFDMVSKGRTIAIYISMLMMLSSCSNSNSTSTYLPETPTTYYDYSLLSPQNEPMDLQTFISDNLDADIILVGEWHSHSAIHRFQSDLFRAMFNNNPNIALSMEQFSRNKQAVVDQYLAAEIGEQTLIKEADAWFNYVSDYRALVEFSKAQQLDVIASNAPKKVVSCIGKEGLQYLDKLDGNERAWVAQNISTEDSAYKKQFLASMHHGTEVQNLKHFAAQVTWDETMAESMVQYLDENPNKRILHIAGKFHVENGLGIAASIKVRSPDLKVVIITPVTQLYENNETVRDYQLQVLAPPLQYVQYDNMLASYGEISLRNHGLECKK